MAHPPLPSTISVLPGTNVEEAFANFEVFEAMHHSMDLCNPMGSDDLDAVLEKLALDPTSSIIDLGCGHGEALIRAASRFGSSGHGVDLSPWVLMRAEMRSRRAGLGERLDWTLGDAGTVAADGAHDVAICLGVSWVWGGFAGTLNALRSHVHPGGRVAFGDIQRRDDVERLDGEFADALSRHEQLDTLTNVGLRVIDEVVPSTAAWDDYDDRIGAAAAAWAELHPGPIADRAMQMQADWKSEHLAARLENVTWTVWVAEKT